MRLFLGRIDQMIFFLTWHLIDAAFFLVFRLGRRSGPRNKMGKRIGSSTYFLILNAFVLPQTKGKGFLKLAHINPNSSRHTYVRTYVRTAAVRMYVRMYGCTYVQRTYVRTYVCTYGRTYVRTYLRTYVPTYVGT